MGERVPNDLIAPILSDAANWTGHSSITGKRSPLNATGEEV